MNTTWVALITWSDGTKDAWEIFVEYGQGRMTEAMEIFTRELEGKDYYPAEVTFYKITKEIAGYGDPS